MSALVYLQTLAFLLIALGAATIVGPLVSTGAAPHRPLLLSLASFAVPTALFALLLFGLRVLLD